MKPTTKTIQVILLSISGILIIFKSHAQLGPGTYTVGTLGGESYSSLTNAGGIFEAINTLGISGNISIEITSDLPTENGTVAIDQWAPGFSITIVPQTASIKTITHTNTCVTDLIRVNGADNLTIDGRFSMTGSARYLNFISACPDQSVIELLNDCQNITIRNCIVSSDNSQVNQSNGGAIHVNSNQINGSDNLHIYDNLIQDYSGAIDLFDAMQINAPNNVGAVLDGLEVINNEILNANGKGIYLIDRNGEINASLILRNSIYATGIITGPGAGWAFAPIQLESGSGHTIRANYIGGQGPLCSGGKMTILMDPGSLSASMIRMKIELPNSVVNTIDSNVIRNIHAEGSFNNQLMFNGIRIESGNCNIGSLAGNYFGETSVNATTPATSSIFMTENFNSTSNAFRFVYTSTIGNVIAENNEVGGILLEENNVAGISCYLFYSSGSSATFNANKIGGVTNNILKKGNGDFRVFYSTGDDQPFSISGNTVNGMATGNNFTGSFYGIRVLSGNGNANISDNTIENLDIQGTALAYGIRVENPVSVIDNNVIKNIVVNSINPGTQFYGINVNVSGSSVSIKDNRITDISLLNPTIQTNSIAIFTNGSSNYTIDANYIENFVISSASNSSYFRGIYINSAVQNILVNNVILNDNGLLSNDIYIYGIYDNSSSGISDAYFNTVDVRGTGSGSRRSSCYYRTGSSTRNIQNNLFNNLRSGGTGGHYSMYHNSTGGAMICQYNLLYAEENSNKLVRFGSNMDFPTWQATGFGANSVNPLSPQILVDFNTGQQTTIAGNDIANPIITFVDHIDAVRPQGLGHDMGAFEIVSEMLMSPLPVELVSFDVSCNSNSNILKWGTISEFNNSYFTLEVSVDGTNWSILSEIEGAGISSNPINYQFIDPTIYREIVYYRLSQTDLNGAIEYFTTVGSECFSTDSCDDLNISITNQLLEFSYFEECIHGDVAVVIYDVSGREIHRGDTLDSILLSTQGDLGFYLIYVYNNGKIYSQKCVLTNG